MKTYSPHKMPTEYIRKENVNRGQWSEGNLREAVRRLQVNKIKFTETERYYGISVRTLKIRLESGNLNEGRLGPAGNLFSFSNNQVQHVLIRAK
jgi:hypothetical protein